ncbi:MAG: type II secretion system protein GspC [Polyangiales bacterium]
MATAANNRLRNVLVLATLAICALFCAQGATALLAERVLSNEVEARPSPSRNAVAPSSAQRRRDPGIILRRNIFNSALGDLSSVSSEDSELPMEDLPAEDIKTLCSGDMRVIGTVVIPGDLERSLAAIVGTDKKAGLHYGGTEVEGSRIRAIESDAVVLQSKGGLCRLAMFQVAGAANKPVFRPAKKVDVKKTPGTKKAPTADRNAGLSESEMAEGIDRVNDRNYTLSRSMLNKVLDSAGKIIGIAAVAPKIENGESIGMEIRGIRPDTLLTKIGIQNGDILESINGQSLSNPDAALGAYTTLRTADKFTLSVRRGGQSMMINYSLQ